MPVKNGLLMRQARTASSLIRPKPMHYVYPMQSSVTTVVVDTWAESFEVQ